MGRGQLARERWTAIPTQTTTSLIIRALTSRTYDLTCGSFHEAHGHAKSTVELAQPSAMAAGATLPAIRRSDLTVTERALLHLIRKEHIHNFPSNHGNGS